MARECSFHTVCLIMHILNELTFKGGRLPPPLLCADLPMCPNPPHRRCNWRFLGIFASPQDAMDTYEAGRYVFFGLSSDATLCRRSHSLWKDDAMEIRTIHLTRQEVERAALELGAMLRTVQQWRYRGVPARWQLKQRRTSSVSGKSRWQRVPKHAASPSDLARTRANGDRARRKL